MKVVISPCINLFFALKLKTNKRFNFGFIFTLLLFSKGANQNEDEDLPLPNIAPSKMVTEAVSLQSKDWQWKAVTVISRSLAPVSHYCQLD